MLQGLRRDTPAPRVQIWGPRIKSRCLFVRRFSAYANAGERKSHAVSCCPLLYPASESKHLRCWWHSPFARQHRGCLTLRSHSSRPVLPLRSAADLLEHAAMQPVSAVRQPRRALRLQGDKDAGRRGSLLRLGALASPPRRTVGRRNESERGSRWIELTAGCAALAPASLLLPLPLNPLNGSSELI